MAVWDTVENKRTEMTRKTLESLAKQVNMVKHRVIVSDNGSCDETQKLYEEMGELMPLTVIKNRENLGTARAINIGWSFRNPGEHAVKMDNDCVVNYSNWADDMEEAFKCDPSIGILGLKRTDLAQCPDSPIPWYKSVLRMLPHKPGERWIVVEDADDIMGTCTGFNSAMMEKFGGLYQMQDEGNLYGYDDNLACVRAHILGFKTAFLPHIDISHIDPGGTAHSIEKSDSAGRWMNRFNQVRSEFRSGIRSPYWKDLD